MPTGFISPQELRFSWLTLKVMLVCAVLALTQTSTWAGPTEPEESPSLTDIRLSAYSDYSRLVFVFSGPIHRYTVSRSDLNELRLDLETQCETKEGLYSPKNPVISHVSPSRQHGRLQITVKIKTTRFSFRHFPEPDQQTIVLDIRPTGLRTGPATGPSRPLRKSYKGLSLEVPGLSRIAWDIRAELSQRPRANTDEALFVRALDCLIAEDNNKAIKFLKDLPVLFPESEYLSVSVFLLGDAYYYQDQWNSSNHFFKITATYREALSTYPTSSLAARGTLMIGLSYLRMEYPNEAVGYFSILIKDHPDSIYAHLARLPLSQAYIKLDKPDQAREAIELILALEPAGRSYLQVYFKLGQVYFIKAIYTKANEVFKDILTRNPDFYLEAPEILYYLGEGYYHAGLMDKARIYLYHLLNIHPGFEANDMVLARIGDAYKDEELGQEAKNTYRLTKDIFPESTGALISQIRLSEYGDLKDISNPETFFIELEGEGQKASLEIYQDIIDSQKDSPLIQLAMFKIGMAAYRQKNYDLALKIFKDSLLKYPRGPVAEDVHLVIGNTILARVKDLYEENNYLDLISFYSENKHYLPERNLVDARLYAALSHLSLNLYREAVELFLADMDDSDTACQRLTGLGRAYFELEQYDMAAKTYTRLLKDYPDNEDKAQVMLCLARIRQAQGRNKESLLWFEKAAAVNSNLKEDGEFNSTLGRLYLDQGLYQKASEVLKIAAGIFSQDPEKNEKTFLIHAQLGRALAKVNRLEEAASTLDMAMQVQPEKPLSEALYLIAQTYFDLNRPEQAQQALDLIIKTGDSFWKSMVTQELEARRLNRDLQNDLEKARRFPHTNDES